ncbi:MAG: aminodeoxychorismate/anthranilate synthase component II [Flavobacteriaceae bacterium]|nr:aminodeoxychorismate/anthranilate synthase component II [Flavobacteriaceae bacterium]
MKIIIIDNYDSFTYNLAHQIESITGVFPDVYRNDKITLEFLESYDKIVLSPGPGVPSDAGLLKDIIKYYAGKKPMLGVCLGLQAITEVFGGEIINMDEVFHGVATTMKVVDKEALLFKGMDGTFEAGRYHSWIADKKCFPKELKITATDDNGEIMSLEHTKYNIHAVQFHPESILTPKGDEILRNFLEKF